MNLIGTRIKEVRKDYGLSQKEFAESICVSTSLICQMESGKTSIMVRTIKDVCKEYHVNWSWLVDGIGKKYGNDTITPELISELKEFPFLYDQVALSSKHMQKHDWKMAHEFLSGMEG